MSGDYGGSIFNGEQGLLRGGGCMVAVVSIQASLDGYEELALALGAHL